MALSELHVYVLLFLVIGASVTVVSLIYRSEELGAIAMPLLLIPATVIIGLRSKPDIRTIYKYFIYGTLLALVLEMISYMLYVTIAGKATSLGITFGITFFLLYEYITIRKNKKAKNYSSCIRQ